MRVVTSTCARRVVLTGTYTRHGDGAVHSTSATPRDDYACREFRLAARQAQRAVECRDGPQVGIFAGIRRDYRNGGGANAVGRLPGILRERGGRDKSGQRGGDAAHGETPLRARCTEASLVPRRRSSFRPRRRCVSS
ncbi:hypothetical protein [Tahibacter soli]|uniref:Uncharacterized protein n=1 Tax=Tahibacter soli TaxID=2983605 RepID=A0A9X4BGI8_9GAMM|nr:hypothetical protein [Tahibacter soli]MDC8012840.1 hypothetical protein [Tahibacter soli]